MKAIGVIPARWGSTRFPGKILTPICGKPLIQWVVERVQQAEKLDRVVVATDDERILQAVEAVGAEVCMTRANHPSGTDRIAEVAEKIDAEVIINIQGDEPLIDPALIDQLAGCLCEENWDMATAVVPITDAEDIENPSVVKAVFSGEGQALYFSRSVIPHIRDKEESNDTRYWRHIGIYGYTRSFLTQFVAAPQCELEKVEKLEQLRALHIGCRMKVIKTQMQGPGVDNPEDVAKVEAALKEAGLV